MLKDILVSLRLVAVTIAVCAVAYPIGILAVAAIVAPQARLGSLVANADGGVVGSRLIAQAFTKPEYFWPRPSACDYNASGAGGSNLSPSNPAITQRAKAALTRLDATAEHPAAADLVTTSGSGLDPNITLAAAENQLARVAKARGISETRVIELLAQHAHTLPLSRNTDTKLVNVLEINLALDAASPTKPSE
jgi:K+-transporting ATPase ATPase C chain